MGQVLQEISKFPEILRKLSMLYQALFSPPGNEARHLCAYGTINDVECSMLLARKCQDGNHEDLACAQNVTPPSGCPASWRGASTHWTGLLD